MDEQVVMAGANDRELIGMFCNVGKKAGNLQARLPMFLERKPWCHDLTVSRVDLRQVIGLKSFGQELAVVPGHLWFWIKSFQMAGPALHEQENYMLCPGGKSGYLWRKRIGSLSLGCETVAKQQVSECQAAKAQAKVAEKPTSRQVWDAEGAGIVHGTVGLAER